MSALGSLVVKLALDHAEYTQGLDRTSQEALKFAKNAQGTFDQAGNSAKEFLGNVAAGAAGAIASFVGIDAAITRTSNAINVLASLDDAAQKTGSSIADLSRIEQTARNFGDAFAPIEQSISRLAKGLAEVDDPSNDAIRALDAIGVSARDSNGQLRTSADVYIEVAKSLQNYEDGAQKTAVANALFGKSGAELLPVLNNIAQGIDDVSGVSEESTKQADEFNNAVARSSSIVNGLFMGLAIDLLPTLNNIVGAFNESTGSLGSFTTASVVVSNILKGLAIAGAAVVHTFGDVGREIGGRAAQLAALANLDFKGASFIGDQLAQDFVKSQVDFGKFVDTILDGDKKLEQVAADGGMKKTIDFAMKVPEALAPATAATRSSIDASQAFMDKLESEAEQLGKTSAEIRKMEAAKLGLSNVADPLIDKIESETAAAKQLEAQLRKVESITQANMTADERFGQTIEELNQLMQLPEGGLSPEVYSRAVQKAQDELESSMNATKQAGIQAANEWDNIWRTSENTARMAFTAFAAHGTSAMESIGQSIKTAIIDVLYQLTVRKWVINVGAAIGMDGGIGGAGAASGFGVTDILSAGSNLFSSANSGLKSMIGRGASALGFTSFGAGASGASSAGVFGAGGRAFLGGAGTAIGGTAATEFGAMASMSSMAAAAAGPLVIAAAADMIFRSLAGDKTLGNKVIDSIPVIGSLGALLFGHGPMKFRQQVAIGDASAEGFDGRVTDVFRAKGGLLVGNKHKEQSAENEDELLDLFSSTIKGYADASRGFAENLGLDADVINNYSKTIRLESEKGKTLTEEAIRDMLSGIGNEMAQGLLPSVDTLKKSGEDSMATLSRLNTEFVSLTQGAQNLGASVAYAKELIKGMTFKSRTALIELAGGVESLGNMTGFFAQNFLTEAERLAPVQEQLVDGLSNLGLAADLSNAQYKALVQSLDTSDETRIKLLMLGPALFEVNAALDAMNETIKAQARTNLGNVFDALQRSVDAERKKVTDKYNTELEAVNTHIQRVTDSIGKLKSLSDALASTVDALRPMSRDEAKFEILGAINTAKAGGGLPEVADISRALDVLKSNNITGVRSSFELAREQAKTANLVADLGGLTDSQLSIEERSLRTLERQQETLQDGFDNEMKRLDSIVEQAQAQIDALNGLNTAVVDLTTAIGEFNLAAVQGGGGAIVDPGTGLSPIGAGNPNISNQAIIDYFKKPRTPEEIARDAIANGVTSRQIINTGRFTQAEADKFFRDNPTIPRFANGGIHRGGLRIVGERGPELERTGPSHITSNSDLKKTLGNDDIVKELRLLRAAVEKSEAPNRKVSKILKGVTQGGTSLRTKSATA